METYWVVLLVSLVSTYLVLHTLHESYELKWTEIEFGEFQLHPAAMCKSRSIIDLFFFLSRREKDDVFSKTGSGFVLLAPLAALSYRIIELRFGFCHMAAKTVHAVLNFLALILGLLGVASMWKTHESKSHFQTIHSWLGIVVLTAFTFQFISAVVVLFLVDNAALRARFLPYHRTCGIVIVLSALCISVLGLQSMVWKRSKEGGFSTDEAWLNSNIASSIIAALILVLAFSLYGGKAGSKYSKYKTIRNEV